LTSNTYVVVFWEICFELLVVARKVNWESDLCETKPDLYLEKGILFRKQVKGPEDPKLVHLPADFSSFPPAPSGERLDNCKWHEESDVRMYVAPNGPRQVGGRSESGL
jgi:hypothetical protein